MFGSDLKKRRSQKGNSMTKFGENFLKRKKKSKTHTIDTHISQDNVTAHLAPFLTSIGYVHDNEECTSITLGALKDGLYPITFTTKEVTRTTAHD